MRNKQIAFIEAYLRCWNATQAAKDAGYSARTARSIGSENLTKPDIQAYIQKRLEEMQMSADEVLSLLTDQARSDMGEFLDVGSTSFSLNLKDAKERNLTKLIKKVRQKTTIFIAKKQSDEDREVHEIEIELYDAQHALELLGKHHELFAGDMDKSVSINIEGLSEVFKKVYGTKSEQGA